MKTIALILVICATVLCSCTTHKHCYRGSDCSTFAITIDDSVKYVATRS